MVYEHYRDDPYGFEVCAARVVEMMDPNFCRFSLTRPWRDGGRDALGYYRVGRGAGPITIECALEAKCYRPGSGVGVHEMSRLISRMRYRQFGVMVTTAHVADQAYREVVEDGHPVVVVSGGDLARILVRCGLTGTSDLAAWLAEVDSAAR